MQSLATQVLNGINSDADQTMLYNTFSNLNSQITKIADTTSINGNNLLSGNQTISVVSGSDGVNSKTTLIQGIDISTLQTALNDLSFAVESIDTTSTSTVTGTSEGSGTYAQQSISFNAMANGDSATVGGLTFTANSDLTASEVANIFYQKIANTADNAAGTFTNSFQGGYNLTSPGSGSSVTFTASATGANSIAASGNITSLTTPITSSNVASTRTGVAYVAPTYAQQSISFNAMANGDSATVGGLTFTANSDLTASEVANIFYQKIANTADNAAGTFTNSFQGGYNLTSPGSGSSVTFTGSTTGPMSSIGVSATLSTRTPLSSSRVSTISSGSPSSVAQYSVTFPAVVAGDTATVGGLTFTASSNLTPTEIASIFAAKINSNTDSSYGSFSNSFVGGFTAAASGALTLTGSSNGVRTLDVSGRTANATITQSSDVSTLVTGSYANSGNHAQQLIQFRALSAGETATFGELTLSASANMTAKQVATAFLVKVQYASDPPSSTGSFNSTSFSYSSQFSLNAYNIDSGQLYAYASSTGPKDLIPASGSVTGASGNTALSASDVTTLVTGTASTDGAYAQQTVQFHDMFPGETVTLGGSLTFTANTFVNATTVANNFSARMSNSYSSPSGGYFSGYFYNSFSPSTISNGALSIIGTYYGPQSAISVSGSSGSITSSSAYLSSSNVTTVAAGSAGTPGVYAQQTVSLIALGSGDTYTISGLTFTAASDLTDEEVAALFASKITSGSDPSSSIGSFSGDFVGDFSAASSGNTLTLTGTSYGPMSTVSVSGLVSGEDNADTAIGLINTFLSQVTSAQSSLSAATDILDQAYTSSTEVAVSSQKSVDAIEAIDLTALQANLQALSVQQSLDFQVISQMNTAASSLLSIFR
jgi:flagellin-like hook-associated protein FlgL